MRAVSQVLIATVALALGVQADEQNNEVSLVPRQLFGSQPQLPPPRSSTVPGQQPAQQPAGLLGGLGQPKPTNQPGGLFGGLGQPKQPAQPAPKQPNQPGGLFGGLSQPKQPAQPAPKQPNQPGGLLGALGQPKQPAQPAPKQPNQPGGLLGALGQPKQPAQPKQPNQPGGLLGGLLPAPQPAGLPSSGGILGGLLGGPAGNTKPIAIKACPATTRCRGFQQACVPHPNNQEQYLCVKVDDDCGGRRLRACPGGQACLADPRDRDACVNGWCNNVEGICVTPPKK